MSTKYSMKTSANTHSSQEQKGASLKQTTSWVFTNPYKLKNIEMILCILSEHNAIKLKVGQQTKLWKIHKLSDIKQFSTDW